MPVLSIDGKPHCQSTAIARYAAKKAGLYPSNDEQELIVDESMEVCQDALSSLFSFQGDEDTVIKLRSECLESGKIRVMFDVLNTRITETTSGWLSGGDFSLADIWVMNSIGFLQSGQLPGVPSTWVGDNYPKLKDLAERASAQEAVANW